MYLQFNISRLGNCEILILILEIISYHAVIKSNIFFDYFMANC